MTENPQASLSCVHYLDVVREEAGGVVRAVLDVVSGLAEAGANVTLLTQDATDVPAEWLGGGPGLPHAVEVDLRKAKAGESQLRTHLARADVLHVHTPWDLSNPRLAGIANRLGVPYVVSVHGMLDDWCMAQRGMKKRLYLTVRGRRFLEGAARVHLTAEDERRQAMKWAPKATAAVLPLVMDLSPYRELPGPSLATEAFPTLGSSAAKLLFLSRVHPKKGIELLIDSVARLRDTGTDVVAMVAGPGEDAYVEQLKQRASAAGVGESVHFLGMVRGAEKLSLYQACDLFVLPTSQENFGIVLTEAMVCGTPVVTTRGVDIWREIEERGALIVDRTADAIAETVKSLLADREALDERGRRSRAGVLQWLDPQTVVAGYIAMYEEIAASNSRG